MTLRRAVRAADGEGRDDSVRRLDLRAQKLAANGNSAKTLADTFAAKATAAGLNTFVFDRNGRRFHGKVKTFADAAREAGLKF